MAHSIDAHGQEKLAKTTQKHPLVTSPTDNPKPKRKNLFFSIWTRRLSESVEGLTALQLNRLTSYGIVKLSSKKWPGGT